MKIIKNVGSADRILRLGASLMMLYLAFIDNTIITDQVASILLGIFGSIIFLTAIFSMCPLYNLIDLNTCNKHNKNNH